MKWNYRKKKIMDENYGIYYFYEEEGNTLFRVYIFQDQKGPNKDALSELSIFLETLWWNFVDHFKGKVKPEDIPGLDEKENRSFLNERVKDLISIHWEDPRCSHILESDDPMSFVVKDSRIFNLTQIFWYLLKRSKKVEEDILKHFKIILQDTPHSIAIKRLKNKVLVAINEDSFIFHSLQEPVDA